MEEYDDLKPQRCGCLCWQAMAELLSERMLLVNDLIDYGSELSALTGWEQIVVEVEELSRWCDSLRRTARQKTTEITAALQQAASYVSHS